MLRLGAAKLHHPTASAGAETWQEPRMSIVVSALLPAILSTFSTKSRPYSYICTSSLNIKYGLSPLQLPPEQHGP